MLTNQQIEKHLNELYYLARKGSEGGTVVRNTLPTVDDDNTQGFTVGSRIFVPDNGTGYINAEYICTDNSTGAAVWQPVEGYYEWVGLMKVDYDEGNDEYNLSVDTVIKNTLPEFTITGINGEYNLTSVEPGAFSNMVRQSGLFARNNQGWYIQPIDANEFVFTIYSPVNEITTPSLLTLPPSLVRIIMPL